eukprot:GHVR01011366.1.p2 GENE.GHVR01011366.1~~GHVR01011366.1.p2  ORF type:complete len:106 (-),score=23.52 GHVR01011366.1:201-518(-)
MTCKLLVNLLSISGVFILSIWALILRSDIKVDGLPTVEGKKAASTACLIAAAGYIVVFIVTLVSLLIQKPLEDESKIDNARVLHDKFNIERRPSSEFLLEGFKQE